MGKLDDDIVIAVMNRVPGDWMTSTSREFALESMQYNMAELRKLAP